jgi:hypothetical protein
MYRNMHHLAPTNAAPEPKNAAPAGGNMHHEAPKNAPAKFEELRQFPLLTTTRAYPLGLYERIVYSYLAYRSRLDTGDSIRQIAAATGIDRPAREAFLLMGRPLARQTTPGVSGRASGEMNGL